MIERLIITKSGDNMSKSHKFDNNDNNDAAIDPCVKRAMIRLGDPFSVYTIFNATILLGSDGPNHPYHMLEATQIECSLRHNLHDLLAST